MARTVTMIPASVTSRFSNLPVSVPKQRRVAAYVRVSTEKEEQLSSYEAQVDYYTKYIKERPDWDFVFVYTDEGITATNTKKRDGFNHTNCAVLYRIGTINVFPCIPYRQHFLLR